VSIFIARDRCLSHASELRELAVSAPNFALRDNERVVAFRCTVHGARIVRLVEIPPLWEVKIENGNADTATIEASILVGAAAFPPGLTEGKRNYFEKFLIIEKTRAPLNPFSVVLHVTVSVNDDMSKFRQVNFGKELLLSPTSGN
jgi:hypothetical protein